MPFKLLATADIHLGKKSASVPKSLEESSVRFSWLRMVDWAIDNEVDALLLAGDIVDEDNKFFEVYGPVQQGFERLQEAEIPVVLVTGNHDFDVLPDIIRSKDYEYVHLLGKKGNWESVVIETKNGPLQFLGWSFPSRYVKEDPLLQVAKAEQNLDPNLPTIGLLHGELFDRESPYAPLDISNLVRNSVDTWILGHIHKPGIHRPDGPLIFYTGSPHALSSKEPGLHGPWLLTVEGRERITPKQIALSPVRYDTLEVDISGVEDETQFRSRLIQTIREHVQENPEALEQVSRLVCDMVLTGRHSSLTKLDQWSQLADQLEQELVSETVITIRKVINQAEPGVGNLEELAQQPDPPGMLAKAILDLESGGNSQFLERLRKDFKERLNSANASATYRPLVKYGEQYKGTKDTTDEFLLSECRQLLGALLAQKEEG